MRITFVCPPAQLTGGTRVITIYAGALQEKGHEVMLVSVPHPPISLRRKFKSWVLGRGWPRNGVQPSHFDGLNLNHKVIECYRPIVDEDLPDADVVIATWWETAEWVSLLSPKKGKKAYFIQHHEIFSPLPVERCKATYQLPLHKIVIARWLLDVMRDQYGDSNVYLVPNAVDRSQFFAPNRDKQQRPTVGFLFAYADFKGVDITLQAIARIKQNIPNLRVLSFGMEVPENVLFWDEGIEFHHSPRQEDIKQIYASCDVWMTASRSEGFNLPAMEAMACRTPVVSTKTGWPDEAIVFQQNGMLVEIDDVLGMAKATSFILSLDSKRWKEMSAAAYETVRTSSWTESANLFESALTQICE